jgi:hypothetical protein
VWLKFFGEEQWKKCFSKKQKQLTKDVKKISVHKGKIK